MRIPLSLTEDDRVILNTTVKFSRGFGYISFIVDTGSSTSMIGVGDAMRCNIQKTGTFVKDAKIGGISLKLYDLGISDLWLRDEKDEAKRFKQKFLVAKPASTGESALVRSQSFPSLIGIDFLRENKFALYLDPSRNIAFLESTEEKK